MRLKEITDESALSACTLCDDGGNVGVCHAVLWLDLRLEDARRQPRVSGRRGSNECPDPTRASHQDAGVERQSGVSHSGRSQQRAHFAGASKQDAGLERQPRVSQGGRSPERQERLPSLRDITITPVVVDLVRCRGMAPWPCTKRFSLVPHTEGRGSRPSKRNSSNASQRDTPRCAKLAVGKTRPRQ